MNHLQKIPMKCQDLLSVKNNDKKIKMVSAAFVFGTLRINYFNILVMVN